MSGLPESGEILKYALMFGGAGIAGAIVRLLIMDRERIVFPRIWHSRGRSGIDFGFVGSIITGCLMGLVIDRTVITSFVGAAAGPELLEQAIKRASKSGSPFISRLLG